MTVRLSIDRFAPHQGEVFQLQPEAEAGLAAPLPLTLREVADKTPRGEPGSQFSLLFTGPAEPYLRQRTYTLEHPVLGAITLFLVPVGRARDGAYRYEAAFNLMPEEA